MTNADASSLLEQDSPAAQAAIRRATQPYQAPDAGRSLWQVASAFLPFLGILALMYWSLDWSYFITLALGIAAAAFVVRIFIIQHDCGHSAFFRARWANSLVGALCSLVTFTPYAMWRRQHAGHHSHWNNLDRRETGADIYSSCLTVREYRALSPWAAWRYRVLRHPLVALVLLPPVVFLLLYRLPFDTPRSWRRERRAVQLTNLGLLGLFLALGLTLGFGPVALVQGPIIVAAAMFGIWIFSVQHCFESALWARQDAWNSVSASLDGSSYLKLPRVLQWFTGNIGFHHVHHLNPRIPNYRLQACHEAIPALQKVRVVTPGRALAAWRCALWDEEQGRMVPFRALRGRAALAA